MYLCIFFLVNTLLLVINLLIHHLVFASCKSWTTYSIVRHKCTQGFFQEINYNHSIKNKKNCHSWPWHSACSCILPSKFIFSCWTSIHNIFYSWILGLILIVYAWFITRNILLYDYDLRHFNLTLGGNHPKARKTHHDQVKNRFSGSPSQRQIYRVENLTLRDLYKCTLMIIVAINLIMQNYFWVKHAS